MKTSSPILQLIEDQSQWSQATFGSDAERGPVGPLKHLCKETVEASNAIGDITEHADILILQLDSSRRAGHQFVDVLIEAVDQSLTAWGQEFCTHAYDATETLFELNAHASAAQENHQNIAVFGRMLFLAVYAASKAGFRWQEVIQAAIDKMAENKQRQWPASPPGNDEPVEHVRDA